MGNLLVSLCPLSSATGNPSQRNLTTPVGGVEEGPPMYGFQERAIGLVENHSHANHSSPQLKVGWKSNTAVLHLD